MQEGRKAFISALPASQCRLVCRPHMYCATVACLSLAGRHCQPDAPHKLDSHLGFISLKQKGEMTGCATRGSADPPLAVPKAQPVVL